MRLAQMPPALLLAMRFVAHDALPLVPIPSMVRMLFKRLLGFTEGWAIDEVRTVIVHGSESSEAR